MFSAHVAPTGGPSLPQVRRLVTALPGPQSAHLMDRLRRSVPRAVSRPNLPVFAAAAGGGVVVDVDGNSLIDLGSGIAVTTVGNSHPRVVQAVQDQVSHFTHTCFMVTPYQQYVELAEALGGRYPGIAGESVRAAFFNSGAEAVENAVKIARTATGRQAIVTLDHAFHGRTNLTMSMTAKANPYKSGFGPFAGEIYRMPGSYPFRDHLSGEEAAQRMITRVRSLVGDYNVAAVVLEPIQGEGGFIVPAPGFIPALAEWCAETGAIMVVDEIQSGIGRTGDFFAIEHENCSPDMITVAKGLAGGMPLSGVVGRADLMDAPGPGGIGGTYGGNPAACAAALAVLEAIEEEALLSRAREIGALLVSGLEAIDDPRIGDIRGRGAMIAIELVDPETGGPDSPLAKQIAEYAIGHGVIVLTCGTFGNVLRFLPPLAISDDLLKEAMSVLKGAFSAL
ncbi:MAG: 4-aminobutyrate--2-oxoglutarate transaminase [Bifidobacteriaceae bacterium]|jgi:4-aminobutyrate aminotransferase/(S)-3-amino-2-methylpropionate transaminase|nr:4-aminobutyrate--2-oxoglutarate transaminase [Bifidobacteriaceae bacterium]